MRVVIVELNDLFVRAVKARLILFDRLRFKLGIPIMRHFGLPTFAFQDFRRGTVAEIARIVTGDKMLSIAGDDASSGRSNFARQGLWLSVGEVRFHLSSLRTSHNFLTSGLKLPA